MSITRHFILRVCSLCYLDYCSVGILLWVQFCILLMCAVMTFLRHLVFLLLAIPATAPEILNKWQKLDKREHLTRRTTRLAIDTDLRIQKLAERSCCVEPDLTPPPLTSIWKKSIMGVLFTQWSKEAFGWWITSAGKV